MQDRKLDLCHISSDVSTRLCFWRGNEAFKCTSRYITTFTYSHELWGVTKRLRLKVAEMSFLCAERVHWRYFTRLIKMFSGLERDPGHTEWITYCIWTGDSLIFPRMSCRVWLVWATLINLKTDNFHGGYVEATTHYGVAQKLEANQANLWLCQSFVYNDVVDHFDRDTLVYVNCCTDIK